MKKNVLGAKQNTIKAGLVFHVNLLSRGAEDFFKAKLKAILIKILKIYTTYLYLSAYIYIALKYIYLCKLEKYKNTKYRNR